MAALTASTAPVSVMPASMVKARVLNRYRPLPAWPRMFAIGKLRHDNLFDELEEAIALWENPRKIIDIGCGYGLPACWLAERFPNVHIFGCDPDQQRVFFAQRAVADRGDMLVGAAPDLPEQLPNGCDLALFLDMAHYLSDEQARASFSRCRKLLHEHGGLLARFVIRPTTRISFSWHFEDLKTRFRGLATHYRTLDEMRAMATAAGFTETTIQPSANADMFWLVAKR